MANTQSRPSLRPVETIVVPDGQGSRALMLRDTQGVAPSPVSVPLPLVPIVARFTGRNTCAKIAEDASRELGEDVPVALVVKLANELERALFVDGDAYREARARIEKEFADAKVRPATHAGGAYHADKAKLATYIDETCIAAASANPGKNKGKQLLALVAPHIDPWRGAVGYGHAYGAMRASLPSNVETVILFGTSHAPMRRPFALCRKAFDTPFGAVEADTEALDAIAAACSFDPYADQFNHKREHSLEFQAVFLKHLVGDRRVRIVPILASLGEHQARGTDPATDRAVTKFYDAVTSVIEGGRAVIIAGADFAHVGPRFGDPAPYDKGERAILEKADRASIAHACEGEASAFWSDVSRDLETRRVCGLGPVYSLLRALPKGAKGSLLHYEQNIDPDEGSIVSHAALGFFG